MLVLLAIVGDFQILVFLASLSHLWGRRTFHLGDLQWFGQFSSFLHRTVSTHLIKKLCLVFSPKDGASNAFCCRSWVICTSSGKLKLEAPYILCYVSKLQVRFLNKSKKKQKREVSGVLRVRSGTILFTLQCPMGWACLALGCQEGSSIACCGWSFELITTRGPPRPS